MMDKKLVAEMIKLQRKVDRDRRQYELDAWMNLHLGIGQLKALFFISNRGATTTGKLADALNVTPTDATGIVDRLLEKNLITRNGDSNDRRVILLRATSKGDDLVAELREKRRDISARRMAGWEKNVIIASIPAEKIQGIAEAISKSTAGTAEPSRQFEALVARIKPAQK